MHRPVSQEASPPVDRNNPLILYDIPAHPGNSRTPAAWSGNTLKTRLALTHKRLPFRTHWLPYAHISPFLSALGVLKPPQPGNIYTLPAVSHPVLQPTPLADSFAIALWLELRFPDHPALFPGGEKGVEKARRVQKLVTTQVTPRLIPLVVPKAPAILEAESAEWFVRTRKERFGLGPDKSLQEWGREKGDFGKAMEAMAKVVDGIEEEGGPLFCGEVPSYADMVIVALFGWMKAVDEDLSDKILRADSTGRLAKLLEEFKRLQGLDVEVKPDIYEHRPTSLA